MKPAARIWVSTAKLEAMPMAWTSTAPPSRLNSAACARLRPVLLRYAAERQPAESFGDFCLRAGVEALAEQPVG